MKIIFFGTPGPSAFILEKLVSCGLDIAAVVTSLDKPKGRGLKLSPSPAAELAEKNKIKTLKPAKASDPELIKELQKIMPDLAVVVAYGNILPKGVLEAPKHGCINLHTSLLPKYRGPSPIQSALLNGDKETGVTIMKLNEKMDKGDILLQEAVQISEDDNSQTLSDKLFEAGSKLLIKAINDIEAGKAKYSPQDNNKATYCKKITKQDGIIDLSAPAEEIVNKIRAFTPWPGAVVRFGVKKVKMLKAEKGPGSRGQGPGEVVGLIKSEGIVISTGKDSIIVKELQPENSKVMSADQFVSGYHVKLGDKFD